MQPQLWVLLLSHLRQNLKLLQKLLLSIQTHWLSACRHHTEEHTAEMSACFIAATNCVPTKQRVFRLVCCRKCLTLYPEALYVSG